MLGGKEGPWIVHSSEHGKGGEGEVQTEAGVSVLEESSAQGFLVLNIIASAISA